MSTVTVNKTTAHSFVSPADSGGPKAAELPIASTPQDTSAHVERSPAASGLRRQDGQLRQSRFDHAEVRQKRELPSAATNRFASVGPKKLEFPSDAAAGRADQRLHSILAKMLVTGKLSGHPFPPNASVRPFIDAFCQAAEEPQVLAWLKSKGLDVSSVRIFSDRVEGNELIGGVKVARTFTASDGSGWGDVGAKLTVAANTLAPDTGVLMPRSKNGHFQDLGAILNFYGVGAPRADTDRPALGQLLSSAGWPPISNQKRSVWRQQFGELLQGHSDIDARSNLASQLLKLVTKSGDGDSFNLGEQLATVRPEATLAKKSQVPRQRFEKWLETPAFDQFIKKIGLGGENKTYRIFDGDLAVRSPNNQWVSLGGSLKEEISKVGIGGTPSEKAAIKALDSGFKQLVDSSTLLGNTLYSRPMYDARQFLAYSGLGSPGTPAQIYSAIGGLSNSLPASPPRWTLPNYSPVNPASDVVDDNLGINLVGALRSGASSVQVPEGSSIAPVLDAYQHVLVQPQLQDWFKSKGLETSGLLLNRDSITGYVNRDGVRSIATFSTTDGSGWWEVSAKLRKIMDLLDPADEGLYYMAKGDVWLPSSVVLQAYDLPVPRDAHQKAQLAQQLEIRGLMMPYFKNKQMSKRLEDARQTIGDLDERAYLADFLERKVKDAPDDTRWDWSEYQMLPSDSSSLSARDQAVRDSLGRFSKSPALLARLKDKGLYWEGQPFRVSEGKFEHQLPSGDWINLTSYITGTRGLASEFRRLVDLSQARGQALYSLPCYDIRQILDHKGLGSPRTAGETRNVVRWLRSGLPPAPPMGNYAGLIDEPWSPGKLTADDKTTLKVSASARWAGPRAKSFDYLDQTSLEALQQNPAAHLEKMLSNTDAQSYGEQLSNTLNRRGSKSPKTMQQHLVVSALILHAEQGSAAAPGHIAGYNLYQPANMGRTFSAVRRDLEKHLSVKRGLDPKLAVMVAQIRLAQVAPEFLVQNVPKEISVGTPAWMELRLGSEMAERNVPGASRMMNEEQISELTTLAPINEGQATLMQLRAIRILLDWAVLNGVIPAAVGGEHPLPAIRTASEAFFKQRKEVNDAMNAVTELPSRRAFAIRELLKVFPGTTRAQLESMKVVLAHSSERRNLSISEPRSASIIEIYMTGDLKPGKWVLASDMPQKLVRARKAPFELNLDVEAPPGKVAELDSRIRNLPDLKPLLNTAVAGHSVALKKAYATQLKLMFSKLPLADRQLLNDPKSVVNLFTVRGATGLPPAVETQADREAARGRQGTLMRVELDKQVCYFEVFANGKIIKRTDLAKNLILGYGRGDRTTSLGLAGSYATPLTGGFSHGLDLAAYSSGTTPKPNPKSLTIVDSLGRPIVSDTPAADGQRNTEITGTFTSAKTQKIATLIAENNLYESDESMLKRAEGVLPLEKKREALDREKAILKGLVPFLGAYQEFAEGNIGNGFFCLTVDVAGLIIGAGSQARTLFRAGKGLMPNPVSGAIRRLGSRVAPLTPKIAWAKPVASFSDRAFDFIKQSALFSSAVMNPADGYADMVAAGVKGLPSLGLRHLGSGVSKLADAAPYMITVEEKLRGYWLAGGWDPVATTQHTGMSGTSQGVNVDASKVGGLWYAIDPETGEAFGTPLHDFKPANRYAV
ncbi:hypothetical protein [Pseudomonas graminis]